jgi:predicted nucleotidyltransferase
MERTDSRPITESDGQLADIVNRLVTAYRPERVYLFGSKARGDAGADSDYDILVVVADSAPPELRRSRLAYEVLWGTGLAADVLILTRSRFESALGVPASLSATVVREGRLLHVA